MIYPDSYQTTIGSAFVTKAIETGIKQAIIKDGLDSVNLSVSSAGAFKPIFITGYYPSETEIPLFTHPISLTNFNHSHYLCTDLRLFIRKEVELEQIEQSIKNLTEYNFIKSRAILNLLWLNGEVSFIKNSLMFAGVVFSQWIADVIAKAFALDFKDQTTIAIIAHAYYLSLFDNQRQFDSLYKEKLAVHTIKATRAPAELVLSLLDRIDSLNTIQEFCEVVIELVENVRLKNFNVPVLLTLIKNSWYGTNVKEILAVSLEHPPTWISIVYACLSERTYKNSMIYRIAERLGKRGASDEFMANYKQLILSQLSRAQEEIAIYDFE